MSVRKRSWKNGSGEESIRWTVDVADADGHRERRQFKTRKEADAFRIEIEGQMRSGAFRADAGKLTVADAAAEFLNYCEGRRERGERMTRTNYVRMDGHIYNYICPDTLRHEGKARNKRLKDVSAGIGRFKLQQLTARAVGDFRDRLRDAGVSVITTRKILSTLHQLLGYAISRDMIGINPAHGVRVIGRRDEGARKVVPPTKETMRILLRVAKDGFKVQLAFAAATGVRAGELHALRWRHIDFEAGEVKIETRVDAYGEEDVTKTAAGLRTVPIALPLITMLKAWKLRSSFKKPDDLVFPNERGDYQNHDNMVKRSFHKLWERWAEQRAKEPEEFPEPAARFNWHALRHFAVSCWIEAGLSPKTVQTFAGHSSLAVTMDRYGHLFKSEDHKAAMEGIASTIFK